MLNGGAYEALDARGTRADPDAAASSPLLPRSLRTLELRDCGDIADALRVLRRPRLRPPPGAMLSLHAVGGKTPQWPVYLDASPRPPPAEGDRRAWLPAGFAAARLRLLRVSFEAQYDVGYVPGAPLEAAELLCRLLSGAPDSYSQMRLFVPAGGVILGVSGEPIRASMPGDAEERFRSAEALAKRVWCCACPLALRVGAETIDGDRCVAFCCQDRVSL